MSEAPVLWSVDERGVGTITLDRPERNNAYDGDLLHSLHTVLDAADAQAGLRAVVIKGNGRHFQAGADLTWLNETRAGSPEHNVDVSRTTTMAVDRLNHLGVVTVALVVLVVVVAVVVRARVRYSLSKKETLSRSISMCGPSTPPVMSMRMTVPLLYLA